MTTVLIADDQALVRVGLRKILDAEVDATVVGEAADGEDVVAEAGRLRPDVVLMDIRMPVLDGIEATRRIARSHRGTRIVILTTLGLDGYVFDALRAGAAGFMLEDAPPEEIAAAVRIVARGEALLAPAVTLAVIEEFARHPAATPPSPPTVVAELARRFLGARSRLGRVDDQLLVGFGVGGECVPLDAGGDVELARGGAHPTRTRSPRPAYAWPLEPRDLRTPGHQRGNRQNPRRPHPSETRHPRPRPGRHLRLREQPDHAGRDKLDVPGR